MDFITQYEGALRLGIFAFALLLFAALENVFPRKDRTQDRWRRWRSNLALVGIDTILLRVLFPVVAVGVAIVAAEKSWGLFNIIALPVWLEIMLAIILLDAAIYWQHRIFHLVPFFWRFHKVHHADRDLDVTSGVRFHPIEIIFSMTYKMGLVLALGPAAIAVILFEILLSTSSLFNHANWRLPGSVDKVLRLVIVTPDFHRVHHSTVRTESDRNFGFFLSVWDHLFRSYQAAPKAGHDNIKIGLDEAQTDAPNRLLWNLTLPFKKPSA